MRIAGQSTITACEQTLRNIARADTNASLRLPSRIRTSIGGGEAALAQVIVTWAQRMEEPQLATFLSNLAQINDFVRRLPGITSALCCSAATATDGATSITEQLIGAALARLDAIQGQRPRLGFRGSSSEIVCADHLGRDRPYLLYLPGRHQRGALRPRENFRDLARWLLMRTIPEPYRPHFDQEAADAIGAMLFETFKNTEDHALVDADGNLLRISIRAVKTDHHAIRPDTAARLADEFPPLANFCAMLAPAQDAAHAHLFELSIIDSGPGFASTWTGKPLAELSEEEEETAVRECFGRGSAKGQDRFGEGLPHVLRVLQRQGGFLRLRTGRQSFYLDYGAQNIPDGYALQRFAPPGAAPLAPAAGSLVTILLPMRRGR